MNELNQAHLQWINVQAGKIHIKEFIFQKDTWSKFMKSNIKIHDVINSYKHQLSGPSPTFAYFLKSSVAIIWLLLSF